MTQPTVRRPMGCGFPLEVLGSALLGVLLEFLVEIAIQSTDR